MSEIEFSDEPVEGGIRVTVGGDTFYTEGFHDPVEVAKLAKGKGKGEVAVYNADGAQVA